MHYWIIYIYMYVFAKSTLHQNDIFTERQILPDFAICIAFCTAHFKSINNSVNIMYTFETLKANLITDSFHFALICSIIKNSEDIVVWISYNFTQLQLYFLSSIYLTPPTLSFYLILQPCLSSPLPLTL